MGHMYENELKGLELISSAVGSMPDMVQGGGGNTSVKLDDTLMAVKASGFMLKQVTTKDGYVVVNYKDIKDYYDRVDLNSWIDYEKDSVEFAKKSIVKLDGQKELRPSVEAGFHSVMKKYVIHSHAVYANIICCSKNGKELVGRIFGSGQLSYLWIPYINPGFSLTLSIIEAIKKHMAEGGSFPEAVFMENHGLIVTADDAQKCVDMHAEITGRIKEALGIAGEYPEIKLKQKNDSIFESDTDYLKEVIREKGMDADFLNRVVLYPDQLVYLNGSLAGNGGEAKLEIKPDDGRVIYRAGEKEARTMEETLLAYVYVIDMIGRLSFELKTMDEEEIGFIAGWESEKYRKSLAR